MTEQLSRDFWLHEFTDSDAAARAGIDIVVPDDLRPNLQRLVDEVMQPFRDVIGKPIVVTSGYRPPVVNKLVGGARTSKHMLACCCDFKVIGMTVLEVCMAMRAARLPFDQLIHEFGQWTHVGTAPVGQAPAGQVMTAMYDHGVVVYRAGLPRT